MEFVEGLSLREWLRVVGDPVLLEPEPVRGPRKASTSTCLFDETGLGIVLATARAPAADPDHGVEAMPLARQQAEQNRQERSPRLMRVMAHACAIGFAFSIPAGLVHPLLEALQHPGPPAHRAILVHFGLVTALHEDRATDPGARSARTGTWRRNRRAGTVDLRADLTLWERRCTSCSRRGRRSRQNQLALRRPWSEAPCSRLRDQSRRPPLLGALLRPPPLQGAPGPPR